jgi:hypothetical protein
MTGSKSQWGQCSDDLADVFLALMLSSGRQPRFCGSSGRRTTAFRNGTSSSAATPPWGLYASDAHLFYRAIFSVFHLHVLLDHPLAPTNLGARFEIFSALEAGRFFSAVDGAAAARGFRAERDGATLRVRTPFDFAHETIFFKNGREVRRADGPAAELTLESPGPTGSRFISGTDAFNPAVRGSFPTRSKSGNDRARYS